MNPQDTTKFPMSQLAIKMEPVPLNQIIHPWAEHQISKIIPAAAAYDARKSPPIMCKVLSWPNKKAKGWKETHLV